MVACEVFEECPFFNDKLGEMPTHARVFKRVYCSGTPVQCARYMVFDALGVAAVPDDLFPNNEFRARRLIKLGGEDQGSGIRDQGSVGG
jgi:hypothetical protein